MSEQAYSERLTLVRHRDADDWIDAVADDMARALEQQIASAGRGRMLLSGGTTPAAVYQALAERELAWDKVDVSLADERWLSPQDRDSNAWLVRDSFLQRAEGAHFDPLVRVGKPIAECVHDANLVARSRSGADLLVLGMGNDGHTASLFPGSRDLPRALASTELYTALDATGCPGANQWPLRITLTPAGMAATATRLLLLRGKQKLDVLEAALASNDVNAYPILSAINAPGATLRVHWAA